jgi:sigma-E factor negative regulatory protein RseB
VAAVGASLVDGAAPRAASRRCGALIAVAALAFAPVAWGQDAAAWLARAASAARQLNYAGTIVYQQSGRVETARIVHVNDGGQEFEKLVNLDGPPREVIRGNGEVRCYYPDARVVRIEPVTFRNAFPSLSPQQQKALAEHYDFRVLEGERVAGQQAQVVVFEPKDGQRYGHKFWADAATGLLLKARLVDERRETIEQFAFLELAIGGRIDRELVKPSWPPVPPDWQVRSFAPGDAEQADTGWQVGRLPAGFTKTVEGFRTLRGKRHKVAHLMFTDGLVAVSVFVETVGSAPHPTGLQQVHGINAYSRQLDDQLVIVLGEVPPATLRQIALSVGRRPARPPAASP